MLSTPASGQPRRLGLRFHGFRDDQHVEVVAQRDQRLGRDLIVGVVVDAPGVLPVDLQDVEAEMLQMPERRAAGAEIVEREGHALRAQLLHENGDDLGHLHGRGFGDLEDQAFHHVGVISAEPAQDAHPFGVADGPRRHVDRQAQTRVGFQRPQPRHQRGAVDPATKVTFLHVAHEIARGDDSAGVIEHANQPFVEGMAPLPSARMAG
jgi:hypothetical protein